MEDEEGEQVHTYIAEIQLAGETSFEHPEQPSMDELAASIRQQLRHPACGINRAATRSRRFITASRPAAESPSSDSDPSPPSARHHAPAPPPAH